MDYKFLAANFITSYVACYLANHVKINFNFSWKNDSKEENTTYSESTPIVEAKNELLEDTKSEHTTDPSEIVGYSADDYISYDEAFAGLDVFSKDLREQEETIIKTNQKISKLMKEDVFHKYMEFYLKSRDDEVPKAVPREIASFVN